MRLDDTLHLINEIDNLERLKSVLETFADIIGVDGSYVINLHPSSGISSIDSRPVEWVNYYNENRYLAIDPIARAVFTGTSSFTWDDCLRTSRLTALQKKIMNEASDFGIQHGFNTSINDNVFVASTCGLYWRREKDFKELSTHYRPYMDIVGTALQNKFNSLVTPKIEIPHLSPREVECLTWAALGKTNEEIGTILNISGNTVNSYLSTASKRLGVHSKIHAVVKAMQLKIIYPF